MKDRLNRRGKKTAGEQALAPEPLQPKYFDNDAGEKPIPEARVEPSAPEPPEPHPQADGEPAQADSNEPALRPTRRRRRRGARGSGRRAPSRDVHPSAPPVAIADASPVSDGEVASDAPAVVPVPIETASPDTVAAELPPTPVAPVAKARKGTVVLAIGLPGSGKSSWFKRHNIRPLSSDLLRELLFDDAEEQRFQDLVFSNLRSMLRARLIARRPLSYVDATNLTPHDRHSWIKLAKDYGYDVQGVFFDVPLEVCLERHARRGRLVPEDIMRKMAAKLKPPTFDEGFSKITVVRVKKKEGEATAKSEE